MGSVFEDYSSPGNPENLTFGEIFRIRERSGKP